jgi:hypothetical protein
MINEAMKYLDKVLNEGRAVLDENTKIESLDDMVNSREYQAYLSDKLGNDLFINDPDRADRIHNAAENGDDGSTHREVIEDQREFLDMLVVLDPEDFDQEENDRNSYDITQEVYDRISKELDEVEQWHVDHKTIDNQVGY